MNNLNVLSSIISKQDTALLSPLLASSTPDTLRPPSIKAKRLTLDKPMSISPSSSSHSPVVSRKSEVTPSSSASTVFNPYQASARAPADVSTLENDRIVKEVSFCKWHMSLMVFNLFL